MKNNKIPVMYMPHAVFAYVHHNQRVAAMVTLKCETDFALKTDILQELGRKLAMQATVDSKIDMEAKWMFDATSKIQDIVKKVSDELGEEVHVYEVSIHGSNIFPSSDLLYRVKNGLK